MLKVTNLTKTFRAGDGGTITAVDDVSFALADGVFASVIGRSGSGKSTLLSLLGALDRPTRGAVEVAARDITKIRGRDLDNYRCKEIGFVFQNYQLIPNLTARENVCLAMEFASVAKAERIKRAENLLNQVGIEGSRQLQKPGKLSGGEQQRVAIARALANKPNLILADEPTGNLDDATGKMIFDLLHQLSRDANVTIVAVTHDLDIAGRTDISFHLSDGKLVNTETSRKN